MAEKKYIDIAVLGNARTGKYIENNDALDNAFRLFISSSKNEYLRRIGGNWLTKHIGKPMNSDRSDDIKSSVQKGILTEFSPLLTILDLKVTPDYVKKKWIINLVAYSEQFRVGINQTYLISNKG